MRASDLHPLERSLHRLAALVFVYRSWFIYLQVVLFGACVLVAAWRLDFRTDPNDLFSAEQGYLRHWLELKEEFQVQENLVTLVESGDLEKNRQFVERLAARLAAEPEVFTEVFYKGDLRALGPKGLLLLPEPRLRELLDALREHEPLLRTLATVTNLVSLFSEVDRQIRDAGTAAGGDHPLTGALPALTRIVEQSRDSMQRPGTPPAPGLAALFTGGLEPVPGEYMHLAEGRFYVLTCSASEENLDERVIRRLRELIAETRREVPGVNAGITGGPVLRYEEMRQALRDTTLASIMALTIVALTFILCYHQVSRPLKATVCLVVGIGYTLGFATLTVGHLNILTITFIPILIGLAIDFGVHLVTRFEEALHHGQSLRAAVGKAMVISGAGICTGGLTTAAAFLGMTLTGLKGIREMGLICGGGLLLCLVPMLTMLPALLLQEKAGAEPAADPSPQPPRRGRPRLERFWLEHPRTVAGVGLALTLLAGLQASRVQFDYNLLNLQSQDLPAVVFERKLVESSSRSALACLITADSIEEAVALEQRLRRLDSVAAVDSVIPWLAGEQQDKLDWVGQIRAVADAIPSPPPAPAALDRAALQDTLGSLGQALGGAVRTVQGSGREVLAEQLKRLRQAVTELRESTRTDSPGGRIENLGLYQRALFRDLATTLAALQKQDSGAPLAAEDLPAGLQSRFIGRTGKFLLQVYPKEDIWERAPQEAFVRELQTIAPDVTGSPVRFYEYTSLLRANFQKAALYAVLAITVMLFAHFRNLLCPLLALLPALGGILWTLGAMVALDLAFNPANIIALTLLIGIGVSIGVHLLTRFVEEGNPELLGTSTGKAVLVSALTTAMGFGSLMVAGHAGIASLGKVMALGAVLCLLVGLTVLPAVLLLLSRSGRKLAHGWLSR